MIETRPGVTVDAHSRWMFQGNEVTHAGVLSYFKTNLYLESGAYFILNRHGDRVEKAHIDSVLNFPLFALSLTMQAEGILTLLLDTQEQVEILEKDLFAFGEDALFFFHPGRGIPVRLRASAMMHAINEMEETHGQLCWKSGRQVALFRGEIFHSS